MARLADPNDKAPPSPEETRGPQPPMEIPVEAIPKEGITAADLALKAQAAPDPQKDPLGYQLYIMTAGFESVHKRLNQQGELLAQVTEKIYGPQGHSEGQAPGVKPDFWGGLFNSDTVNKFLDLAREQFGGGSDRIYYDIGKRVVDGATDTAIKGIIRNVGREAAGSIVHVG